MKSAAITIFLSFSALLSLAQAEADTTIYNIADAMPYPLLRSCSPEMHPGWTVDSVRRCAESQLYTLLARNIRYPAEAHSKDIQGTVVISCVVEPTTGRASNLSILKDIGGGCGDEAIRVMQALDEAGLRWQPGVLGGKPIRVRQTLPIRFRLQESLPYYITPENDTLYTVLDKGPEFAGGMDSLANYVLNRLAYPTGLEHTCKTGIVEMALIIKVDGTVSVMNQLDFSNLGLDFQFEAMRLARGTAGKWAPAEYEGKPVNTTLPLRAVFKSDSEACAAANEKFDNAMLLADKGATLLEQEKPEEAIQVWSQALELQPDNCELLYYRGTACMNLNRREEACKDYNKIKEMLGVTWFESVRRLVCGF